MDVGVHPAKKSVWRDLPLEVDQVWAEAFVYWQLGEPLYLPKEVESMAQKAQDAHREASGKEGLIRDFLEREIPSKWDAYDIKKRRMFLAGNLKLPEGETLKEREKVCAVEIWVECFWSDPK